MRFAILGGDGRMALLADYLTARGDEAEWWDAERISLHGATANADATVLPILPFDGDGRLNAPFTKRIISRDDLIGVTGRNTVIFAGKPDKVTMREFEANGIKLYDYFAREEFAVRNAAVTAEGAVEILMRESKAALWGMKVLVVGFGRIGKLTALKLKALGADVTCAARKPADFAWMEALGLKSAETGKIANPGQYHAIINTVPAPVIGERTLADVNPRCILIDLASMPGGFDETAVKRMSITVIKAPGLPGKSSPETAAKIIGDTIYNIYNIMREADILL